MTVHPTAAAALLGAAVALSGCSKTDTKAAAPADTARAWAVAPTSHGLQCTPSHVNRGEIVTMRMTLPHGRSFHVLAPDGTPFIVIFHGEGGRDRGARRSLMPPDSFARRTELRLDTRTARGGVWVFGRDTNETLFQVPGTYRFIVGDDLETDGPSYAECLVTFSP